MFDNYICESFANIDVKSLSETPTDLSTKMIGALKFAGDSVLPPTTYHLQYKEIWNIDSEFNKLLADRKLHKTNRENY